MSGSWTPGSGPTSGNDQFHGDGLVDTVDGQDGNDELFGLDGDDVLNGGAGYDAVSGGLGNDILNGGDGDDLLFTGHAEYAYRNSAGWATAFYFNRGGGNDVLDGGAGSDEAYLFYFDRTQSVHFDGSSAVITITVGGAFAGSVTNVEGFNFLGGQAGDVFGGLVEGSWANVDAFGGDDVISGGAGGLNARGGDGDDILTGGAAYSSLYGEAGDDHLIGVAGARGQLHGGDGNDVLDGTGGDYWLDYSDVYGPDGVVIDLTTGRAEGVTSGVDTLIGLSTVLGSEGADTITGDAQANHLMGASGDDTIHGGDGDDTLEGAQGDDTLYGGDGDDTMMDAWGVNTLHGEGGDDRLSGGDHADTLDGGAGDDVLKGGAGNDVATAGDGADHLWGDLGDDKLDGGGGDDIVEGDLGNDILVGGAGSDILTYAGMTSGVVVSLLETAPQNTVGGGVDTISGFERLYGSDYADTLTGFQVYGEGGDDHLIGGSGADGLYGGYGDDVIEGGLGDDLNLFGGGDDDQIFGGGGQDWLFGQDGDDLLQGGDGDDQLDGDFGSDTLNGGVGDDLIAGRMQADTLTGGAGKDVFLYYSAYDSLAGDGDTITDFQTGEDIIDVSAQPFSWATITRVGVNSIVSLTTSYGEMRITVNGTVVASDLRATGSFQVHETLAGGGVAYSGSPVYDNLFGGIGDDVIWGRGGGDSLAGGSGRDVFRYTAASDSTPIDRDIITDFESGADSIDLTALKPTNVSIIRYNGGAIVSGGVQNGVFQIGSTAPVNGADILGLTAGIYLVGENVSSSLVGSAKDDTVVGGAAGDVIIGGGSGDALYGGAGTNTFVYASAAESNNANLDIIHDFKTGVDKIDLTALAPSNVSIIRYNGGTFVNGGGVGGALQIGSITAINGSDIVGLTAGVYIVGEDVNATLIGSAKDDTIVGGNASDTIIGGATGDALFGKGGADTFVYRSATESNPNAGMLDIIHDFQTGTDKLDLTAMAVSNVSILHYQGGTFIAGASNSGVFQIASVHDINASDIVGLTSGAYIVGDELANTLVGAGFSETIVGGDGNDVIIGGGAADALFGGAGADTFKFLAKTDSVPGSADIIHDFQTGVDKIDLTALHTHGAADKYSLISDANASYLFVQLDGNTGNDLQILFATPSVQASDILW